MNVVRTAAPTKVVAPNVSEDDAPLEALLPPVCDGEELEPLRDDAPAPLPLVAPEAEEDRVNDGNTAVSVAAAWKSCCEEYVKQFDDGGTVGV